MAALESYGKWDHLESDEDEPAYAAAWEAAKRASAATRDREEAAAAADAAQREAAAAAQRAAAAAAAAKEPAPFNFDLDAALGLLEDAEPAVCCTFFEALSRALFNSPKRKRAAFDAGALAAIVGCMAAHAGEADIQAKGSRAMRHLCFGNDLACAAAAASGAVAALAAAIRDHETAAVRSEAVWALTTLCGADSEVNVKAASRTCFDTLERIANDLDPATPKTSAMAMFLCEKIRGWRCGGNR